MKRIAPLLLVSALLWACATPAESARDALAEGKLTQAESIVDDAIADSPNAELFALRAEILLAQGRAPQALAPARTAADLAPESAYALRILGRAAAENGQLIAACQAFYQAYALRPGSFRSARSQAVEILPGAAERAQLGGDPEQATRCYFLLEQLDAQVFAPHEPAFQRSAEAAAASMLERGALTDAVTLYEALSERFPDRVSALYTRELGRARLLQGQPEDAERLFAEYREAGDVSTRGAEIAAIYEAQGFPDRALTYYTYAAAANAEAPWPVEIARLHLANGDEAQARTVLDTWFGGGSRPLEAHLHAAEVADDLGWTDLAVERLDAAIQAFPKRFEPVARRADIHVRRGERGDMEALLRGYVQRSGDSLLEVAEWLTRYDQPELIIYFLETFLAQTPNDQRPPRAYLELARAHAELASFFEMEDALRDYVKRSQDTRAAALTAMEMARARRSFDFVIEILSPVFIENPQDTRLIEPLLDAHLRMARLEEGLALLSRHATSSENPGAAWLTLARTVARRGLLSDAQALFEKAANAGAEGAWFEMGLFAFDAGMTEDATVALNTYIDKAQDPVAALATVSDALASRASGRALAITYLERLAKRDPSRDDVPLQIATLHLKDGQADAALAVIQPWVAGANDPAAAMDAALSLLDTYRAYEHALTLIQSSPVAGTPASLFHQGTVYIQASNRRAVEGQNVVAQVYRSEAEATLRKLVASTEDAALLVDAGVLASQNSLSEVSVEAFDKAGAVARAIPFESFAYAQALIDLGRTDDARAVLDGEVARSASPNTTRLEAALLLRDEDFTAAVLLVQPLLDTDLGDLTKQAYSMVADKHIRFGDRRALRRVSTQYVERSKDPFNARRYVAEKLIRAGLYEDAIAHYRAILAARPNATDVVLAVARLTALMDNGDAAVTLLSDFADAAAIPSTAWLEAARFYRSTGDTERAVAAYAKVFEHRSQPTADVELEYGELLAFRGQHDAALEHFDAALRASQQSIDTRIAIVDVLRATLRPDLADAQAAEGLKAQREQPDLLLRRIEMAFERGDYNLAMLLAQRYRDARLPLPPLAAWMLTEGPYFDALGMVQLRTDRGEYGSAFGNLMTLAPRIILHEGAARYFFMLKDYASRMPDPVFATQILAQQLVATGDVASAVVSLGELERSGSSTSADRLQRIHLLLTRGATREAMDALDTLLESPLPVERSNELTAMLLEANAQDEAALLLERRVAAGDLSLLLPWAQLVLAQGDIDRVVNALEGGPARAVLEGSSPESLDAILETLRELGRRGDARVASALAQRLIAPTEASESVDLVRIELAALAGEKTNGAVDALLSTHGDTAERRLELGQILLRAGALEEALAVLLPVVELASNTSSLESLRWASVIELALAGSPEPLANRYVDSRTDTHAAQLDAGRVLLELDRPGEALRYLDAARERIPNDLQTQRRVLEAAYLAGDASRAADALSGLVPRMESPDAELLELALRYAQGPDGRLASMALERYLRMLPFDGTALLELARQRFLDGASGEGDAILGLHEERAAQSPTGRSDRLALLVQLEETERAVALSDAVIADAQPVVAALWWAGQAYLQADREREAVAAFDRYIARAISPIDARLEVSEVFREAGNHSESERYQEKAIELAPQSPAPYLYRGLRRLEAGDAEGAEEDFARVLEGGYQRSTSLALMIEAWVAAGAWEAAERYAAKLLAAPGPDRAERAVRVLQIWGHAGSAQDGARVVEASVPGLMQVPDQHPALGHALVVAYIRAGSVEKAVTLAKRLTRLAPEEPLLHDAEARAALASSDLEQARRSASLALGYATEAERWRVLGTMGRVHEAWGDEREAERAWLSALRQDPGLWPAWTQTVYAALEALAVEEGWTEDAARYGRRAQRGQP